MTILQKTTFLQEYIILNKQMMHRLIIPFFLTLACTAACVHPAGSNDPAPEEIIRMIRHFPLGPGGHPFRGLALR